MARPTAHAATEEVYAEVGKALTRHDPDHGWTLLHLLNATGRLAGRIHDLVDDYWRALYSVDAATPEYLPWLAQWVGHRVDHRWAVARQRDAVRNRGDWIRAAPEHLLRHARPWLTFGNILIRERLTGDEHRIGVEYHPSQLAIPTLADLAVQHTTLRHVADSFRYLDDIDGNEAELQRAVLAEKAGWLVIDFRLGTILQHLADDFPTLQDLATGDLQAAADHVPLAMR